MNRLRYCQDTLFSFLVALLLAGTGLVSLFRSQVSLSNPLAVQRSVSFAQEDGGLARPRR